MKNLTNTLQNIAQKQNLSYQYILKLYALERTLARFSQLNDKSIIVRGSLITRNWGFPKHFRKVQDLDFLIDMSFDENVGKEFIQKILAIDLEDFLYFEKEYKIDKIWGETENPGLRFVLPICICNKKMQFQIDVAFNDPLIPQAIYWNYPDIFGEKIQVQSILPELACAWKIHGLFEFWDKGYRWQAKTLYDIFIMLDTQEFDNRMFKKAIEIAFKDRKTPFEVYNRIFYDKFGMSKSSKKHWEKWLLENEGRISYPTFDPMLKLMRKKVDSIFLELITENPTPLFRL